MDTQLLGRQEYFLHKVVVLYKAMVLAVFGHSSYHIIMNESSLPLWLLWLYLSGSVTRDSALILTPVTYYYNVACLFHCVNFCSGTTKMVGKTAGDSTNEKHQIILVVKVIL
jgi:hypothetical protein